MTAQADIASALAIILNLDELPVSANRFWEPFVVKSRPAIRRSKEYAVWLTATAWEFTAQARTQGRRVAGPFALQLEFSKPGRSVGDLDNLIPGILDAMQQAGVIENDKLCQRLSAAWVSGEAPGVRVCVMSTAEVQA